MIDSLIYYLLGVGHLQLYYSNFVGGDLCPNIDCLPSNVHLSRLSLSQLYQAEDGA
jgi:hypothetical protein